MSALRKLTRRDLIRLGITGGAGLVLGVSHAQKPAVTSFGPNVFLRIDSDGRITIWGHRAEFGQGVRTALPMLVAEELEADWTKIRIVQAPFDPRFGNQNTMGSASVRESWEPLRRAGATAREMLISAAAKQWAVPHESCRARSGEVIHAPTGRKLPYGPLSAPASKLPLPAGVRLKEPADFRLIGKPIHRVDTPSKTDGSAVFSIDVRLPGMLYAAIARPPTLTATVARLDDTKTRKMPGVRKVVVIPAGAAVVADSTWAAIQGRDSLNVTWTDGPGASVSSATLRAAFEAAAAGPGDAVRQTVAKDRRTPARTLEAVYESPLQAHAPMEPINCTAHVRRDSCDVWGPIQMPERAAEAIERLTGIKRQSIRIHPTQIGGVFGRGMSLDFVIEAVQVAKALSAPVKVFRTREDDIQHDRFRPASYHKMSAGLDSDGWPTSWKHHVVSSPIDPRQLGPSFPKSDVDGAADMPYGIADVSVWSHIVDGTHVPGGYWRSVAHTPNAFAVECFLDELAAASKSDPYEFRKQLLVGAPKIPTRDSKEPIDPARLLRALDIAATKAGWGNPLPARQGRGIACHSAYGSYVAQVAEVAVDKDGAVKVNRVVCAIDCGLVVNPDTVAAQMEGGICFGLTAALKGAITIENGRVAQANFNNYPMLRIDEMPSVEVHIIPSSESPGGVGEAGVPPIAPALCNAIFAATSKRIRQLPVRTRLLRQT